MIPGQATEIDDIRLGHGTSVSCVGLADLQFFKIFAKRMHLVRYRLRTLVIFTRQAHQGRRGTLNCGALHIMLDGSITTQLLSATGSTRSAVDQCRQRRTMAGGFRRTIAIDDQQASMPGGRIEDNLFRLRVITGKHRTHQAAPAFLCQQDGLVNIPVRHDRTDRAKRLDCMGFGGSQGLVAIQQGRGEERAFIFVASPDFELFGAAVEDFTGLE